MNEIPKVGELWKMKGLIRGAYCIVLIVSVNEPRHYGNKSGSEHMHYYIVADDNEKRLGRLVSGYLSMFLREYQKS